MRTLSSLIALALAITTAARSQAAPAAPELVRKALAAELEAAQDSSHPMRYVLHKSSPRVATTKELIETPDGLVALLVAVNDRPLSAADSVKEQNRLNGLLADPGKQRHRKQSEDEDTARALKVLRALPAAFIYRDAGPGVSGSVQVERFAFSPNSGFDPPDLETQVLTAMEGELWIDPVQVRVVRLDAHLQQDVDFGWGILGRLNKGGWVTIEQSDVGGGQWRIVRFKMDMTGRVVIKTRRFATEEDESQFAPVPQGLTYQQAIKMLRSSPPASQPSAPGSSSR
ncbi:MAG TPA: hypothetical protein VKB38_17730 [Terracidiphilus sp.]|nr:hypothetical protein [Terracidiphilus sp.]